LAAHLVEMAVDLLQHPLQAVEGGGELLGRGEKVGYAEGGELLGAAVLRPPAPGHLLDAAPDALRLPGAVPLHQAVDRMLKGFGIDGWRRHAGDSISNL